MTGTFRKLCQAFLTAASCCAALAMPAPLMAQTPASPELPETVVEADRPQTASSAPGGADEGASGFTQPGRGDDLTGLTSSASQGQFGQPQIEFRPLARPGEVLELVPGLVATQHSGSGKANQYFLRGFNLDHGTDFALRVDGVPINLPSHAHGQGYLDINFLIPELIELGQYKLGPYYADVGDFSSAGALDLKYKRTLDQGISSLQFGSFDYFRALVANSQKLGRGQLLYAYEQNLYDGPWVVPEDFTKFNGIVRWSAGDEDSGVAVSGLAYRSY